jgi:non-specific serine/threonine protein kinase
MIGQTISHYRILEELGSGGMGVVYKAEDTKLKRTVALKFLPPELTRDKAAKTRFIHEAQAASALQHHNICTIHEIDETKDGRLFICMDCYEGETLKEKIAKGPLPVKEALGIAMQIAEGLSEAHRAGMVHRDVKPANVMLTRSGVAKILDFGLAKLAGMTKVTKMGTTVGTVAYMSPEQARGEEVDPRSDVWSLGVILYEMLAGGAPFKGDHEAAVLYGIINTAPEPLEKYRRDIPEEFRRVVDKALQKDPSSRYDSAAAMVDDLAKLTGERPLGVRTSPKHRHGYRRVLLMISMSLGVVITGAVLLVRGLSNDSGQSTAQRRMIAVLPFENLGAPEDEYFANGTTDAITARLAGVRGLGVISRQSAIQYKKTTKSIKQIGGELGVDYILEGTVQRERPSDPTSRVRVIPQLVRVSDDTHVWADTYDEDMTEVFRVQSAIAERVATQLDVALLEPERRAIEKKPTENLAAYEDYLHAMDYFHRQGNVTDCELSVQLFERAVSQDPQFAEAWAGLAIAYHSLYWAFDRPGALTQETVAANRAEELAPDLPETHLALGYVAYAHREFDQALRHFEMAHHLRPSGDTAQAIGNTLRRLGKWQDALEHFEDAHRLIPRTCSLYWDGLGYTNTCLRRFDDAEQNLNQGISLAPQLPDGYTGKTHVLLARNGDVDAARQVLLEMSRRANPADAAESELSQEFLRRTEFRLFPKIYTEAFDAFESGPIERYRATQPAIIAAVHLAQALLIEAREGRRSASARYDSALVHYERIIRSNPQSAYVCYYHSALALAYAGLGRCEEAISEGKVAARMMPISRDAVVGHERVMDLAEIYMICGKYEAAIDQIETLLSVPSYISVGVLRIDPIWDPIRTHPRFRRLLEGK